VLARITYPATAPKHYRCERGCDNGLSSIACQCCETTRTLDAEMEEHALAFAKSESARHTLGRHRRLMTNASKKEDSSPR
jgi:hypothetical protein